MPQITTIRVVRRRGVQPEQFGNATAEVELTGTVLDGEDYRAVARQMLRESRALVYQNLGLKLPESALTDAEEADIPDETATVEVKRGRGRPKGSKDTAPRKSYKNRGAKDDDDKSQDDEGLATEDHDTPDDNHVPANDTAGEDDRVEITPEDLHRYINDLIKTNRLTVAQAKQMQKAMGIVRVRDLDTVEKVEKAKGMIDAFVNDGD